MLKTETILIRKMGRKPREFHKAATPLTRFVDRVVCKMVRGDKKTTMSRITQSQLDLENLSTKKFALYLDIKQCFPSFDANEYASRQWWLKRFLVRILFSSKVNGKVPDNVSLRGGLSASNAIIEDVTSYLQDKAQSLNVKCFVFVDDIAIYGDSVVELEAFAKLAEEYFAQFCLHFHPKETVEKNSGVMSLNVDQKLSGRLGLIFYRKGGDVFSKIRPSTKRLFLLKLNKRLYKSKTDEGRMRILQKMLYGPFGLYKTWPATVWTCRLDRKLFEIRIAKLTRKYLRWDMNGKQLLLSAKD